MSIQVQELNRLQEQLDSRFFAVYYLRLAGVRFDGHCGRSFLGRHFNLVPDLTLVGENSFWGTNAHAGQFDYDHVLAPIAGVGTGSQKDDTTLLYG